MRIDPAGYPFIAGSLAAAVLLGWFDGRWAGMLCLLFAVFCLFFFRDPERAVAAVSAAVLSPADGRVLVAGPTTGQSVPPGQWQQVSIFLSPMDVHVNRMPIGGTVTKVEYHPGRFLPAYRAEAGDLNEFTEIWVDHDGQRIVCRQIVGILARRIVCRARVGDRVNAGQRFGIMKFGSRMDVFVPSTARVMVHINDRVRGGVSVIAMLEEGHNSDGPRA